MGISVLLASARVAGRNSAHATRRKTSIIVVRRIETKDSLSEIGRRNEDLFYLSCRGNALPLSCTAPIMGKLKQVTFVDLTALCNARPQMKINVFSTQNHTRRDDFNHRARRRQNLLNVNNDCDKVSFHCPH